MSRVIYDRWVPAKVKRKVDNMVVRPVMLTPTTSTSGDCVGDKNTQAGGN